MSMTPFYRLPPLGCNSIKCVLSDEKTYSKIVLWQIGKEVYYKKLAHRGGRAGEACLKRRGSPLGRADWNSWACARAGGQDFILRQASVLLLKLSKD